MRKGCRKPFEVNELLLAIQADEEHDLAAHGPALYHVYVVSAWSGTPSNRQLSEHTEIGWFSCRDAIRLNLAHPKYGDLFARLESWQRP